MASLKFELKSVGSYLFCTVYMHTCEQHKHLDSTCARMAAGIWTIIAGRPKQ